jgi:adenosylcobyric acid synthase
MGWQEYIEAFRKSGGFIFGICGGYQMLGTSIADPCGVEGPPGLRSALGILPVETIFEIEKELCNSCGTIAGTSIVVKGYEIHMGRTLPAGSAAAFIEVSERNRKPVSALDGAQSEDGRVIGTYFHGFFDEPEAREWFLRRIDSGREVNSPNRAAEDVYERLANHVASSIDLGRLFEIAGMEPRDR